MTFKQLIISLVFALFLLEGTAQATQVVNKLESLVMPGPLHKLHAKYEKDCSNCHSPLDKTAQRPLCIKCHENVGEDINALKGFHGRNPDVAKSECKSCHTDHEGPDADILGLNRETFNHAWTDFPLSGKHAAVSCNQCHPGSKKFHEVKADCFSCHEKDDSHQGDMGKDCAACHATETWPEVKFDHSKTKFPLKGGHENVSCKSCHPVTRYKQTPKDCVACHAGDDAHGGRFGQKCESCHNEVKWETTRFDHAKDTEFALKGGHYDLACKACHTSASLTEKISTKCNDCHAVVDIHKGRSGTQCQKCHTEASWKKTSFSHDKDTKFTLKGSHKAAECFACHKTNIKAKAEVRACADCHKADDVHGGQLGQDCKACHGEVSWSDNVRFDHEFTMFPLVGLHAITACNDCHATQEFKTAKVACSSCHKEDDIHMQALGNDCAGCHNPNGWGFWQFDHDTQTKFILDGGHSGLACNTCHKAPAPKRIELAKDCIECHRSDDIHNGRFGAACDRCHTTESFKNIRIGR